MKFQKVFRDPVHNLIVLQGEEGKLLLELIEQPAFQRLRRIRQLGLSCLAYPGAEHSRWTHSLGVCHVARRMLDVLKERHGADAEEYRELRDLRKEILATALLHDVGHGPFSHVFERAIPPVSQPSKGYPKDHEEWSERIIREKFGPTLDKHGIRTEIVTRLISKQNRDNLLAKDFISSQLDADRMDYLLRDSRIAGPKYGEFDLDWLLHSLRIGSVSVRGQTAPVNRLCFDGTKAVRAIEEYIQAREFMYSQVYIHKTTRAYEALLTNILRLAAEIRDGTPDQAPPPCPPALARMLAGQEVSVDEYLTLDDFRLWVTFIEWSQLKNRNNDHPSQLSRMCDKLVNRKQPYKFIELDNRVKQDKAIELISSLKGSSLQFSCLRDAFTDLAYRNARYRKSKEAEEEEDRVIYVLGHDDKAHPVENESPVIDAISKIEIQIFRLYYDEGVPAIIQRLKDEGWLQKSATTSQGGRP